jgi:hypothetical protein
MMLTKDKKGYLNFDLVDHGFYKTSKVHRVVLEAFVGPCPPGMEGRHAGDNNKSNNRASNLAWGTPLQNARDKDAHGTSALCAHTGESNGRSVLTIENVIEIRTGREKSDVLASRFGVSRSQITRVRSGRQWRCVA